MLRGGNAQRYSAIHRMVFDQGTFAKTVWQSTMFSSELYQHSANSRHILHASCDTSVQFKMPSGLKGGITLEWRIHMQLNYPIRSSTILLSLSRLSSFIQLHSVRLTGQFNRYDNWKDKAQKLTASVLWFVYWRCLGDFTPSSGFRLLILI